MESSNINTRKKASPYGELSVSLGENSGMNVKLSYLSPVVVDVCITGINLCSHVEVLRGELGLLLLHVHASTFN